MEGAFQRYTSIVNLASFKWNHGSSRTTTKEDYRSTIPNHLERSNPTFRTARCLNNHIRPALLRNLSNCLYSSGSVRGYGQVSPESSSKFQLGVVVINADYSTCVLGLGYCDM